MRIQIKGKSDLERIASCLEQFKKMLPDGVSMQGVNIYITLKDREGNELALAGPDGEPIEHIAFEDPNKKIAQTKKAKADIRLISSR